MRGFILGGVHGFIWGACMVSSVFFGYNDIRSMSGRYASFWNAFLLGILTTRGKKDNFINRRIRLSPQSDCTLLDISIFLDTHY